jgi:hypothetical protein
VTELPQAVEVLYKREGREETFTGSVRLAGLTDITFAGASFNQVLEFAGDALKRAPEARLVLKREEAPYPMVLPADIENLLRTDLQTAIDVLTVSPRRVNINVQKQKVHVGIRHGHDTLADSLGEEVYIRARAGSHGMQVEDPKTGRWVTVLAVTTTHTLIPPHRLRVHILDGFWAEVKTQELLASGATRLYLPRRWNPNYEKGGWIDRDLLAYMYDVYRKEKSDVAE